MQQQSVTMWTDLARSGLLPSDLDATEVPPTAFATQSASYIIPYYLPDGTRHPHMHRMRFTPAPPGGGKYGQPSKEEILKAGGVETDATYPYLNPHILGGVTWATLGAQPNKTLLLVEGEKKAVAVGKYVKRPAVGLPGCWGALVRNHAGIFVVHPVIRSLLQPGDAVEVVLDADLFTNRDVNRAAGSTRRAFKRIDVSVRFVILPSVANGRVGVDDWIMALPPGVAHLEFDKLPRVSGTEGDGFDEDRASLFDALGLVVSDKGVVLNTEANALRILKGYERYRGRLRYDVVSNRIWHTLSGDRPQQLSDEAGFTETAFLQERMGLHHWRATLLTNAMAAVCGVPELRYNRVLEELGDVAWDGTARLEAMFLIAFGAEDNDYHRMIGRNWLTGAVARLLDPGCQVDTMLVLEGDQGLGKSKALEIIGGCGYVAMQQEMESKDFLLAAHSGWIADVVELGTLQFSGMAYIKGMITTRTDTIRAPYGRTVVDRPRRFVLVGTTNDSDYLRDDTGNRRFWPVKCVGDIDLDYLRANRAQLIAEAIVRYKAGLPWWEDASSAIGRAVLAQQAARTAPDPWVDNLAGILADHTVQRRITIGGGPGFQNQQVGYFFTSNELLLALGVAVKDMNTGHARRLSRCMRQFSDWHPYRYKGTTLLQLATGGVATDVSGYFQPIITPTPGGVVAFPGGKAVKY